MTSRHKAMERALSRIFEIASKDGEGGINSIDIAGICHLALSEKKLNCERFEDWDTAYDAWLKEDAIPHPDSVAYTNEGKCMRMCSMFAQWLYSPISS